MQNFLNYIGQLRLYSLADFIFLLAVVHADGGELFGAVMLHIAFLLYLESKHSHSYRKKIPVWISYICACLGLVVFGHIEGVLYILFSYLYAQKDKKLGMWSPVFRAFQNFFIVGVIIGYVSPIPYIVWVVMFIRNLAGDFRDIEKDTAENMKTLPIIFGFKKNIKKIHLYAMFASSFVWWWISRLSIFWFLVVVCIEYLTYNITPR